MSRTGALLFTIAEEACINCGSCRRFCPVDAIPYYMRHQIDARACVGCVVCYAVCPADAVRVVHEEPARLRALAPGNVARVYAHVMARGPYYEWDRRARARPRAGNEES